MRTQWFFLGVTFTLITLGHAWWAFLASVIVLAYPRIPWMSVIKKATYPTRSPPDRGRM